MRREPAEALPERSRTKTRHQTIEIGDFAMRRLTVSTLALALVMFATGCIMVIGTGRHVRALPEGTHFVEIEGKTFVVDLQAGTVRAAEEETAIGIEIADD